MTSIAESELWWQRDELRYVDGKLSMRDVDLEVTGRQHGTPLYFYDPVRVRDNLRRLHDALSRICATSRVFYALKANRFYPLLREISSWNECGVDVCSPGELLLAREADFAQERISYTGVGVSDHDLAVIGYHPGIWFNCDSQSAIRRVGERFPGRKIGIRINTGRGIGYRANPLLEYAGRDTTKFGIYRSEFDQALALASKHDLSVVGLHLHHGCGYLTPELPTLEEILSAVAWFAGRVPDLRYVNIGGGLGIPLAEQDRPLDLEAWADVVDRCLGELGVEIWVEPGDFLVKDAGVLLLQVTEVERKQDVTFAYVNGGFNIHIEPAFYNLPLQVAPCRRDPTSRRQPVTIAGNINESLDVFASGVSLPPIAEADYLAFLNAGGYGSSMSSNHCVRGQFHELLLTARGASAHALDRASTPLDPQELNRLNLRAWTTLYGQSEISIWGREPLEFLREFVAAVEPNLGPGALILDAGVGEGRNLELLVRSGARVLACDGAQSALRKIPPAMRERVNVMCADLARLPVASSSMDFVLLFDVIETMPEPDSLASEIRRVLRPGGRLLCNIPGLEDGVSGTEMTPISSDGYLYRHRYYYSFRSRDEALSLLQRYGFEVRIERLCRWTESPHPGFREQEHWHASRVFLAVKAD